ncbi:MAG: YgiQ family radical SAM protein, partial [Candidatus Omnitrophota bacterium]
MENKFLVVSKDDMLARGWDSLDVILVTGDAYVDHPSYGAAVIGRVLENAGFKVGVIAQPDCSSTDDFMRLGRPSLFFGVTAGNLDSMVANYTANKL